MGEEVIGPIVETDPVAMEYIDQVVKTISSPTFNVVTATKFIGWGVLPIGCVVAYLKSLTSTPALPDGFVECNGQTLSDANSVYNGIVIPDLNGSTGARKRFLRGSTTSGTTGGTENALIIIFSATSGYFIWGATSGIQHQLHGAGSLPSYYEVVWIMRVK